MTTREIAIERIQKAGEEQNDLQIWARGWDRSLLCASALFDGVGEARSLFAKVSDASEQLSGALQDLRTAIEVSPVAPEMKPRVTLTVGVDHAEVATGAAGYSPVETNPEDWKSAANEPVDDHGRAAILEVNYQRIVYNGNDLTRVYLGEDVDPDRTTIEISLLDSELEFASELWAQEVCRTGYEIYRSVELKKGRKPDPIMRVKLFSDEVSVYVMAWGLDLTIKKDSIKHAFAVGSNDLVAVFDEDIGCIKMQTGIATERAQGKSAWLKLCAGSALRKYAEVSHALKERLVLSFFMYPDEYVCRRIPGTHEYRIGLEDS